MYQITYRGLTIGNDDRLRLVELAGVHDTPDVRTSDVDRARAHGQWAGIDLLTGRAITATMQVVADFDDQVWADMTTALTAATGAESALTVSLPGLAQGRTVQADARVRRLSIPVDTERYQFGAPQASVEWWATDPRWYDTTEDSITVPVYGTQDNGMTFDVTFDLEFGGVTPRGAAVAHNDGNFPAPWQVIFDGPVTNPRIQNTATGQQLEFTGTVPGGSQLVVDSLNRVVQLDGASRYQWLGTQSQWFDLAPGTTPLRIVAESGTGAATLTYRSTWI